tara:strand:+ start:1041 stop:1337 length:297 start_codon:yes stop_codon:yes gene_type:complete
MGKKLPPDQLDLYKRIDEVLFYKWDPIGVSDLASPRDEYSSYLPRVFAMVLEYSNPEPIAEYLGIITTQDIGLDLRPEHDMQIAKLALAIKDSCLGHL